MKPIIIDMRDISDSTEVYEMRPNPVLTGFIYMIFSMVVVVFVWMGFFKMDVVVDAAGMVAAKEVATVTNRISGTITGRVVEDGQFVNEGDILYTISYEEQSGQRASTVKATASGRVNFISEPAAGDYLSAGTKVLTIIPQGEEDAFVVKSYVKNGDIAKIHEGMEVTYEIAAYPSREYGTMTGEVTFISADIKVNDSGNAYYLMETTVAGEELRNRSGEKAALKVGMLCETKVVIERKSVLNILLEKMFH